MTRVVTEALRERLDRLSGEAPASDEELWRSPSDPPRMSNIRTSTMPTLLRQRPAG